MIHDGLQLRSFEKVSEWERERVSEKERVSEWVRELVWSPLKRGWKQIFIYP
jgi:hypothetical protein